MKKEKDTSQLKTNRSLLKLIFLGIITLGIYPLVVYTEMSYNINLIAGPYDGKKTMNYCLMTFVIAPLTLTVGAFVWCHRLSKRIGVELARRGLPYRFGAGTFWGWNILGLLIVIGPFVYMHKLCTAMNMLCADFNDRG